MMPLGRRRRAPRGDVQGGNHCRAEAEHRHHRQQLGSALRLPGDQQQSDGQGELEGAELTGQMQGRCIVPQQQCRQGQDRQQPGQHGQSDTDLTPDALRRAGFGWSDPGQDRRGKVGDRLGRP
jgi:hypothetical protein